MKKQTKSDLKTLIKELENFYHGSEGKDFFNQIESDKERFDFEDRIYNLYNDLQDKLDELEIEQRAKAEKMFREVNEAQEVLLDSKKRSLYDEGHDLEDINSGRAGGMGGMGGVDPSEIFQMFMGGGMGGSPFGGMRGGRGGRGGFGSQGGFQHMGGNGQGFTFRFG